MVSARIPTAAFQELRAYAAKRDEPQDAVVTRWILGQLKRLRTLNVKTRQGFD